MTCHFNIKSTSVLDGESYVFSNDGSAQNGVGTYAVQPLIIKWKSKTSVELWRNNRIQKYPRKAYEDHVGYPICWYPILSKYSSQDTVRNIDFVMKDGTAHNPDKVIEKVKKISYV